MRFPTFRLKPALLALTALVVTARQASAQGDIAASVEILGWLTGAASLWLIVAPESWARLTNLFWDAVSTPIVLRAIGVLNVAIGLGVGWVAFFVL